MLYNLQLPGYLLSLHLYRAPAYTCSVICIPPINLFYINLIIWPENLKEKKGKIFFPNRHITGFIITQNITRNLLILDRQVSKLLIRMYQPRQHIRQQRHYLWFFQWSCMDVRVELWRKLSAKELMLLNCGVREDPWESFGLQGDLTSPF